MATASNHSNQKRRNRDFLIFLQVVIVPGERRVRVPLSPNSIAREVISFCETSISAPACADYCLVGDFDGFEKHFEPDERLYNLVKKQVLSSGSANTVRFFLRKRKKRASGAAAINQRSSSAPRAAACRSPPPYLTADDEVDEGRHSKEEEDDEAGFTRLDLLLCERHRRERHKRVIGAAIESPCRGAEIEDIDDFLEHFDADYTRIGGVFGNGGEADEMMLKYTIAQNGDAHGNGICEISTHSTTIQPAEKSKSLLDHAPRHMPAVASSSSTASVASPASQHRLLRLQQQRQYTPSPATTVPVAVASSSSLASSTSSLRANTVDVQRPTAYDELVRQVEAQRVQIDSNKNLIAKYEMRVRSAQQADAFTTHKALSERLRVLRERVNGDETQLQRVRSLRADVQQQRCVARANEGEFEKSKYAFVQKELELTKAASKVDELTQQLDELKKGRVVPPAEELRRKDIEVRKKLNEMSRQKIEEQRQELAKRRAVLQEIFDAHERQKRAGQNQERPLATVEPYKFTPGSDSGSTSSSDESGAQKKAELTVRSAKYSKGYATVYEAVQKTLDESGVREKANRAEFIKPEPSKSTLDQLSHYKRYINSMFKQSETVLDDRDRSSISSTDSTSVKDTAKRRAPLPADAELLHDAPPPDLIPSEERKRLAEPAHRIEPDVFHLRSDNLRAAKRRSWADHSTNSETEHIRRVLHREQLRGRSNVSLTTIFDELLGLQGAEVVATPANAVDEGEAPPIPPLPVQEMVERASPVDEVQLAAVRTSSEDQITVIDIDPDRCASEVVVVATPVKGILKARDAAKKGCGIRFDPMALLLDAALEGELELVKSSAQQVSNVSHSNDEGITALHNAICAGHYEIVRFLVDADADVNAQDSDGWTPLHCAASCNNLPMVKFLVENGACVFATTISDHETPADKCEEEEDGFDGCSQFLFSIQEKLGVMNNTRVYAAYDFDASQSDEFNFVDGDELTILRRDDVDPTPGSQRGWWWARSPTGAEGYVPRNYLALYPRRVMQKRLLAAAKEMVVAVAAATSGSDGETAGAHDGVEGATENDQLEQQRGLSPSKSVVEVSTA